MKITLEPLESIRPSTYNPRTADPARLDLIELSLRKLGFIAPIFADVDGEILSGHQRHLVASRMGAKDWTSIFIASVLNSVPFREDREHIAVLCAALCRPFTKVYACASSAGESGWRQVNGKAFMNESNAGNIAFRLDYEPGIRIGDFQDKPKVQKYHTEAEFRDLFGPFFRTVKVRDFSNNINATCASALPVDMDKLRAAIAFEFDLPYPDGTRMNLVKSAMDSFSKRLQITL